MQDHVLLCRGVLWPAEPGTPSLSLRDENDAARNISLDSGVELGFGVLPGRWCLGHQLIQDRTHRTQVPCPTGARVARGTQCESCEAADQSRAMHDFHRSGRAGAGLRDYLMQEHWLYIASFAHGVSKIGTAANPSKWRRLAEQGAVSARYVGLAADGAQVRILEDLVTRELGFTQQVRAQSKVRGLLDSRTSRAALDATTSERASRVREFLATLPNAGDETFRVVDEQWAAPAQAAALLEGWDANALQPYPADLAGGEHGFTVAAVLGQGLGVRLGNAPDLFVADASMLKGRKVVLGQYVTESPAIQSALF